MTAAPCWRARGYLEFPGSSPLAGISRCNVQQHGRRRAAAQGASQVPSGADFGTQTWPVDMDAEFPGAVIDGFGVSVRRCLFVRVVVTALLWAGVWRITT